MRDLSKRLRALESAQIRPPVPTVAFDAIMAELDAYGKAKASLASTFIVDDAGAIVPFHPGRPAFRYDPDGDSVLAKFCRETCTTLAALDLKATPSGLEGAQS